MSASAPAVTLNLPRHAASIRQIRTKQVTLLCQDRAVGLFFQFALVRFNTSGFGEEKTVVGRDNNMLSNLLSHAKDTESDLAR